MAGDETTGANSLETVDDLGKSPQAEVKRWKLEIKLADKREVKWREVVKRIYKIYANLEPAVNSFNILWSNTETLRHSVYNSLPQPDVRRRYSDEDELGEQVSEVLTRALEFAQDTYDFDQVLKGDTLSMLLPGRAVSRVRYVPKISTIEETPDEELEESETYEEIEWEQVICERVQWDDFRILCAAKTWDEVSAIGFRHRFSREDLEEKFGKELAEDIPLDSVEDEDVKQSKDTQDLFKTAEVWEIWDKDAKEVLFVSTGYAQSPLKIQEDPLKLQGFFPIPRPLYAIENDQSLVPTPLYIQYEQQAKELNALTKRISKLVDALRVRGIYDATLTELDGLMELGDNKMIPAVNVTALLERGGLEKAIWMMPIEMAAAVLKELQAQREASKQVIYEITGISDIMRSSTNPAETATAQRIKTQWGTQRLQRLQQEVQRYIRDLVRLKAEIIAEKFQPETLEAMTLVKLPHDAQVQQQYQQSIAQWHQQTMQIHAQMAQQQAQPQQPGQPPAQPPQIPPQPQYPNVITWEKVIDAMRNDATRTYRIDIETDSTIASTQDADLEGMKNAMASVAQINSEMMPFVQNGAIPFEALKELLLAVARKAKMGSAVEDALEKMQQPPPAANPEAAKAQAAAQQAQLQAQSAAQIQQAQMQHEQQLEQMRSQNQAQIEQLKAQSNQVSEQARMQADAQVEQARAQASIEVERAKLAAQYQVDEANRNHQAQLQSMQHQHDGSLNSAQVEFDKWKAELDASTKIVVAEITAKTTLGTSLMAAENAANSQAEQSMEKAKSTDGLKEIHAQTLGAIQNLTQTLAKPKTVVRDDNGKIIGTK